MEELELNNCKFRMKKMNAIEILAIQGAIDFADVKSIYNSYLMLLERIEVQVSNTSWLPVRDGNNFYPKDIENDANAIKKLLDFAIEYFKSVFIKSEKSK